MEFQRSGELTARRRHRVSLLNKGPDIVDKMKTVKLPNDQIFLMLHLDSDKSEIRIKFATGRLV